jgi:hypothetical protein
VEVRPRSLPGFRHLKSKDLEIVRAPCCVSLYHMSVLPPCVAVVLLQALHKPRHLLWLKLSIKP